jgi:hypothetical protein
LCLCRLDSVRVRKLHLLVLRQLKMSHHLHLMLLRLQLEVVHALV